MERAFVTEENHICSHCAYIRFEGNPLDIQYAFSKLDLYFYENELEPTGIEYTLYLEDSESYKRIDIFRQVVVL